MAKKNIEEPIVDVGEVLSSTEDYIEENQSSIITVALVVLGVIGAYFAYNNLYIVGEEERAQQEIFQAEQFFKVDSLEKAIYGFEGAAGFLEIADEYGITETGNLAEYYVGVSFLKQGKFDEAIEHLNNYSGSDKIVSALATGAVGDAYMELGKVDEAITYYLKASEQHNNEFNTPIFLKKAGLANEEKKSYITAIQLYERIKNEYADTDEGQEMEKYISRAKMLGDIN
jgi:tetratricopeptide (TPR) repeat protein